MMSSNLHPATANVSSKSDTENESDMKGKILNISPWLNWQWKPNLFSQEKSIS